MNVCSVISSNYYVDDGHLSVGKGKTENHNSILAFGLFFRSRSISEAVKSGKNGQQTSHGSFFIILGIGLSSHLGSSLSIHRKRLSRCTLANKRKKKTKQLHKSVTHTHTHTHIYIYIYIYICLLPKRKKWKFSIHCD